MDLLLFRRQQHIKRKLNQLQAQMEKLSALHVPPLTEIETLTAQVEELKEVFREHSHSQYATKDMVPQPYVHPKKGVCPQKPRVHKHLAKEIVDLKMPEPYGLEDLKRDHPKLREPHLHPPKSHKHQATDITTKIKPEQIQRKGLDADKLDGYHAKELINRLKRVARGGGPHDLTHHTDVEITSPNDGQFLAYDGGSEKWKNVDPIVTLQLRGSPTRIDTTTSGEIVAAPGAGYKLVLCGFVVSVDADEIVRLRWNGSTGPIIATLPTKGIIAMNLIGIKEESGDNQNLYLEKTGTGNAQGTVWTETVAD